MKYILTLYNKDLLKKMMDILQKYEDQSGTKFIMSRTYTLDVAETQKSLVVPSQHFVWLNTK